MHATQGEVREALQKLDVQELPTHEARVQWIAERWLGLSSEKRDATLLFAPTHADRASITNLIREGLKQDGTLKGHVFIQPILKTKTIEAVQQRFTAYYQKGDVVRFNQDFKQHAIQRNEYYTVGTISSKHRQDNVLPLINDKGKNHHFALKPLPHYKTHTAPFDRVMEVYQTKSLELQSGDKVMWTRNSKADGIRNGETLTVQTIQDNQLVLMTNDGQSMALLRCPENRLFER